MGIYSRYSAAFLILALLTPKAFSAVRVPVIQNDEYIRQVLSRQTATTGAISTPAGDLVLFGPDKNYAFNSDGSFRPRVTEVKRTGVTSYPYGTGGMFPGDPGPDVIGKDTRVKVKPKLVVPKANILKGLKDGLKTHPGHIAMTGVIAGVLSGVGWVMSPDNTQLQKRKEIPLYYDPGQGDFYWTAHNASGVILNAQSANALCTALDENSGYLKYGATTPPLVSGSSHPTMKYCDVYYYRSPGDPPSSILTARLTMSRYGSTCPAGSTLASDGSHCFVSSLVPITDSDLSALDPWVSEQSAEWLGGLIRDVCNGSLNPGACYSGMVDRSKGMIQGPALLAGPITTKTTQTPNADGTTKTRTETTKTDFKLTYGKDFFDVQTEKKTTVLEDGELVSETTEKDDTPAQDVADTTPGEEQQPEPEYTFSDSPFPEIKPFYQQKYPDGLSGVWNQAKADIDNSSFMRFLSSFIPSFSGSCPTFGLNFAIGNMANFGSVDFQSLCYVFDFVKIIFLVTAVFAARQLTFGG